MGIGNRLVPALRKMGTHEPLKVKVGELVALLNRKKTRKLLVRKNAPAILGVLKLMGTNIRVDLARHLGASHLRPLRLAEKLSKNVADLRRLYETTGGPVYTLPLALALRLLRQTEFPLSLLLKSPHLRSKGRQVAAQSRNLRQQLVERRRNSLKRRRGGLLRNSGVLGGLGGLRGLGFLTNSLFRHYNL